MNKYDELLEMFTCKDDLRKCLQSPFIMYGKACASDAYTMIMIDKSLVCGKYETRPKFACPSILLRNSDLLLPLSKLTDAIDRLPLEDETEEQYEECPVCEGYGEVTWEFEDFTKEDECPLCHGTGEMSSQKKTGRKIISSYSTIEIGGCRYGYSVIKKLVDAMIHMNMTECKVISMNPNSFLLVELNKHIMFMAVSCCCDHADVVLNL